ncbi:MAG: phosphate ABC transporter permease PstA [Nitrospinae bacterium]|nr:phosphate ABC transporter permease PstA [Nitrospinota bacterium]
MGEKKDYVRGFWAEGTPFIWFSGIAAVVLVLMVVGLVSLILANGMSQFWPASVAKVSLKNGSYLLGSVSDREKTSERDRILLRIANRDVNGLDFKWVESSAITKVEYPESVSVLERDEYGPMYGFINSLAEGESSVASSSPEFQNVLREKLRTVREKTASAKKLQATIDSEKKEVTAVEVRLRRLDEGEKANDPETLLEKAGLEKRRGVLLENLGTKLADEEKELERLKAEVEAPRLDVTLSDGSVAKVKLRKVLAVFNPNAMWFGAKFVHYMGNMASFITDWPRESNTEGGVYPAIFGTVMMVFIMVLICTPLGVLAALYMHEYARQGFLLSAIRLAVNNLAGVPSIVYGIFGLGFFVYMLGGGIDRLFFADKLPEPTYGTGGILWASLTLALLTVPVVVVSTMEGLSAVPRANRDGALALGSSKFQMIWNVVLPNAAPGILTGVILAVSRAAGEVAPLMITGVVKLVSAVPVDAVWPYVHMDRKFMHLGFHIYDVGFQSPNVEAAKPMVYTTAALLLLIVVALNALAILLRNKLRKKYMGSAL